MVAKMMYLVIAEDIGGNGEVIYAAYHSKEKAREEIARCKDDFIKQWGIDWPDADELEQMELIGDFIDEASMFYLVDGMRVQIENLYVGDAQ